MKTGPVHPCLVMSLIALSMLACGSSTRQLQSLSISPAAGSTQVQFTAIGTFVGSSQTAAVNAMWWTNQPWTYPPTPFQITVRQQRAGTMPNSRSRGDIYDLDGCPGRPERAFVANDDDDKTGFGHGATDLPVTRATRLLRDGVGEFIANVVNDFLPNLVFEDFRVRGCAEASRFQDFGLLLEQLIKLGS